MIKLGWFAVRNCARPELTRLLKRLASVAPASAVPTDVLLREFDEWTTANIGGPGTEYAFAARWAQLVSREIGNSALSFFVFEGTWDWALFDDGKHVAGMDGHTETATFLYGDLKRAARILGVPVTLLKKYCLTWPFSGGAESDEEEEAELLAEMDESVKAFPDDEHAPWDEWGHVDFARRLGFDYPGPENSKKLRISRDLCTNTTKKWPALPALLDARAATAYSNPPNKRKWIRMLRQLG